jgi:hypothetical protein
MEKIVIGVVVIWNGRGIDLKDIKDNFNHIANSYIYLRLEM